VKIKDFRGIFQHPIPLLAKEGAALLTGWFKSSPCWSPDQQEQINNMEIEHVEIFLTLLSAAAINRLTNSII